MIYVKEIEEYLNYYKKCPEEFNEERELLINNIVYPTLKRTDVIFDSKMYYKCIKYVERWYYKLVPFQKFIYAFVFMYDLDDTVLFRTFFIMMGRGNGKDGAFIPLFDFLSSQNYGVKGYNVDIVANSESQASDSYLIAHDMYDENKNIFRNSGYIWNLQKRVDLKNKSYIKFNTSNAKTKDGKACGAVFFNEYHAYETYSQIKVYTSSLGKKKYPRIFIVTTQGYVRDGVLDNELSICDSVLHGENNKLRYFPFICKLKKEKDIHDKKKWILANPFLPFSKVLQQEMEMLYEQSKSNTEIYDEMLVKRFNIIKTSTETSITSHENILKASYIDLKSKIERKKIIPSINCCIVGIDFADLNDFASIGFLTKNEDGELCWRQKTFISSSSRFLEFIKFPLYAELGNEGFKDYEIINCTSLSEEYLLNYMDLYLKENNLEPLKIVMDSYRYKLIKKSLERKGYTEENKSNKDGEIVLIRYPASIAAIYAPFIEKLFSDCKLNIGNSAIMRWYINNTGIRTLKDGNKVYFKIEPKLRKNDGFMALLCAITKHELLDIEIVYI